MIGDLNIDVSDPDKDRNNFYLASLTSSKTSTVVTGLSDIFMSKNEF